MVVGVAAPHTPLRLHKKQVTHEDKMNSVVTYNNIRLKCYLNFVLMAPRWKWSLSYVSESYRQFLDSYG